MVPRHGKGYKAFRRARDRIKRQGLPCWICGGAIDYDAPAHHPDSYELDHYTPVARGGEVMPREAGALRPAHSRCNRKRGTSMPVRIRSAS